jgi:hypothetical protein
MKWQKGLICAKIIVYVATLNLLGQESSLQLKVSADFEVAEAISDKEQRDIRLAAEQLLRDYEQYGTFLDPQKGEVTLKASNDFKTLFKATARLFPDYLKYPPDYQVDIYEYKNEILRSFGDQGVLYKISNAEIVSIEKGRRYFNALVRFQKEMLTYINDKGEVKSRAAGEAIYELEAEIEISPLDYSKAQIRDIRFVSGIGEGPVSPPADWESFGSLELSGGIAPFPVASEVNVGGNVSGNTTLSTPATFDLGFNWMTNRFINSTVSPRKNLFLYAGGSYRYWELEQELGNYRIDPFPATAGAMEEETSYTRIVGPVQGKENVKLHTVEFPIGLAYRLKSTYGSTFVLQIGAVPGLVLSSTNRFSGTGTFDGLIEAYNFRFLREGAINLDQSTVQTYQVGADIPLEEGPELSLKPSLWLMASPAYYLDISSQYPVVGLMAALDFRFNVLSYFDPQPSSEPVFRYSDDLPQPLLETINDQVPLHWIGLRVGVYLRLINSPNN